MTDDSRKTIEVPVVAIETPLASPATEREQAPQTQRHPVVYGAEEPYPGALTEKAIAVPAPATRDRATLTVLSGLNAGQVFALEAEETTLGRGMEASIVVDDPAITRKHASFVRRDDGKYTVADLGSTNGTFVGGRRVDRALLASGDRVQLGPHLIVRFAITDETEEALLRRLYDSSTRDALTGAFNRKYFTERLATEVAYAQRHKTSLAVLMIDVDHFKRTNDDWGHLVGDKVLRAICDRISGVIRREDVFARYGGEELAVLARAGVEMDAEKLAERLRAAVEQLRVPTATSILTTTVSIGVAWLSECASGESDSELIALADARLYRAKKAGRNRVCAK